MTIPIPTIPVQTGIHGFLPHVRGGRLHPRVRGIARTSEFELSFRELAPEVQKPALRATLGGGVPTGRGRGEGATPPSLTPWRRRPAGDAGRRLATPPIRPGRPPSSGRPDSTRPCEEAAGHRAPARQRRVMHVKIATKCTMIGRGMISYNMWHIGQISRQCEFLTQLPRFADVSLGHDRDMFYC